MLGLSGFDRSHKWEYVLFEVVVGPGDRNVFQQETLYKQACTFTGK